MSRSSESSTSSPSPPPGPYGVFPSRCRHHSAAYSGERRLWVPGFLGIRNPVRFRRQPSADELHPFMVVISNAQGRKEEWRPVADQDFSISLVLLAEDEPFGLHAAGQPFIGPERSAPERDIRRCLGRISRPESVARLLARAVRTVAARNRKVGPNVMCTMVRRDRVPSAPGTFTSGLVPMAAGRPEADYFSGHAMTSPGSGFSALPSPRRSFATARTTPAQVWRSRAYASGLPPPSLSRKPEERPYGWWAVKTVLLLELAFRQMYPASRPTEGYQATQPEFAWLRAKASRLPAPWSGWATGTARRRSLSGTRPPARRCRPRTAAGSKGTWPPSPSTSSRSRYSPSITSPPTSTMPPVEHLAPASQAQALSRIWPPLLEAAEGLLAPASLRHGRLGPARNLGRRSSHRNGRQPYRAAVGQPAR